jgi:hypothetical protein
MFYKDGKLQITPPDLYSGYPLNGDFITTTRYKTDGTTDYTGAALGTDYDSNGSSSLYFKTAVSASSYTEKVRILGNGNVGIGTASSRGNLALGSATVVKSWNAFNNNSSAGNYTFPRNCVALVHFHYAGGQDLNISAVYRITMAYGGNPTIEVLYSGSYVNATVGHGAHVVRFFGQNLPAPYNNDSYQLRISQISYSGSY